MAWCRKDLDPTGSVGPPGRPITVSGSVLLVDFCKFKGRAGEGKHRIPELQQLIGNVCPLVAAARVATLLGRLATGLFRWAVLAFLGLAIFVTYGNPAPDSEDQPKTQAQEREVITDLAALSLIEEHCHVCHAKEPTYPGFYAPPGGIVLNDRQSILASLSKSLSATQTKYMPLGNLTKMSDKERNDLVLWMQLQQPDR